MTTHRTPCMHQILVGVLIGMQILGWPTVALARANTPRDAVPASQSGGADRANPDAAAEGEQAGRGSESKLGTKEGALTSDGGGGDAVLSGATGAAFNSPVVVGNNGAFSYSIPIEVLPGRHGLMPHLAINYSSGNRQDSWVGFGWNFGIGTLHRFGRAGSPVPMDTYHSDQSSWDHDQYAMNMWGDQKELVPYAKHGETKEGEFRTRHESFTRVLADTTNDRFDNWEIYSTSGYRYHFTNQLPFLNGPRNTQFLDHIISPDKQTALQVAYDTKGTHIVDGENLAKQAVYPTTITYSCATNGTSCYKVSLIWEGQDRKDVIITAQDGILTAWTKRLQDIVVLTPLGQVAWRYRLHYTYDPHNGRSLLSHVSKLYGDKEFLPPTKFIYSEAAPPSGEWVKQDTTKLEPFAYWYGGKATVDGGALMTDLNHDGLPEQVRRFRTNMGFSATGPWAINVTNIGKSEIAKDYTQLESFPVDDLSANYPKQGFWLSQAISGTLYTAGIQLGDYNGDGVLDIFKSGTPVLGVLPDTEGLPQDGILDLSGHPIADASVLPTSFYNESGKINQGIVVADVNGDNLADILQGVKIDGGIDQRRVWLRDATTGQFVLSDWQLPIYFNINQKETGVRLADFNGDGLPDFYSMTAWGDESDNGIYLNTGTGWKNFIGQWSVEWVKNSSAYVVPFNGNNFPATSYSGSNIPWHFIDINGDRITDIVRTTFEVRILLGTADRRFIEVPNPSPPLIISEYANAVRFADIDGNLAPDLLFSSLELGKFGQCALGGACPKASIYYNPIEQLPNVITKIQYPLGAVTAMTYDAYAKVGKKTGAPKLVVARTDTYEKSGVLFDTHIYAYDDPDFISAKDTGEYSSDRGPEFLGFRKVIQTQIGYQPSVHGRNLLEGQSEVAEVSRRRTITNYEAGYAKAGLVRNRALDVSYDHGAHWERIHKDDYTYFGKELAISALQPPYRVYLHMHVQFLHETFAGGDVACVDAPDAMCSANPRVVRHDYEEYDDWGNLRKDTFQGIVGVGGDGRTQTQEYTYNTDKWILGLPRMSRTESAGRWRQTDFAHDDLGRMIQETMTASGVDQPEVMTYIFDDASNLTKISRSENSTSIKYDPSYRQFPIQVTDILGSQHKTEHYGINFPSTQPNLFGLTARSLGPQSGNLGPARVSRFFYDGFAMPQKMLTTDHATGQILSITEKTFTPKVAQGKVLVSNRSSTGFAGQMREAVNTYDEFGRKVFTSTQLENGWLHSIFRYGAYNTLWQYSVPAVNAVGALVTVTADALGRPSSIAGRTTTQSFDYSAAVMRSIDSDGKYSEIERDGFGRTIRQLHSDGKTSTMTYPSIPSDADLVMTRPDGLTTTLKYDGFGRTIKRKDPNRGTWSWTYDEFGNIQTATDALGVVSTRHYDKYGRLAFVDHESDGTKDVTHFYDGKNASGKQQSATALGRRTGMKDASGHTIWEYDASGRVAQVTKTVDNKTFRQTFLYDQASQLSGYSLYDLATWYPKKMLSVRYESNLNGLQRIRYQLPGSNLWLLAIDDMVRNDAGTLEEIIFGNYTKLQLDYDSASKRLISQSVVRTEPDGSPAEALLSLAYTYEDATGHILTIEDNLDGKNQQVFAYDAQSHLIQAESPSYGMRTYQVNPAHSLTKKDEWLLSYQDPLHPHAVSAAKHIATQQLIPFQYDANGSVTKSGGRIVDYFPSHQIKSLTTPTGKTSFTYDGNGNRVKQASLKQGSRLMPFPNVEIMADQAGKVSQQFQLSALGNDLVTVTRGPDGKFSSRFRYTDHLGSAVVQADGLKGAPIMDAVGKVQRIQYTPYGMPIADDSGNTSWDDPQHSFIGVPSLGDGLYLTGPRIYDAVVGSFWQADPLPEGMGSRNAYNYANNDPISYRDPSGLIPNIAIFSGEGERGPEVEQGYPRQGLEGFMGTPNPTGELFGYAPRLHGPLPMPFPQGGSGASSGPKAGAGNPMRAPPAPTPDEGDAEEGIAEETSEPSTDERSDLDIKAFFYSTFMDLGFSGREIPQLEIHEELPTDPADFDQSDEYYKGFGDSAGGEYDAGIIRLSRDGGMRYKTVAHEIGHRLNYFSLGMLNQSGKLHTELVADMFALGWLSKKGIAYDVDYPSIGYTPNLLAYDIVSEKCNGSLGHCGEFWDALIAGDEQFFQPSLMQRTTWLVNRVELRLRMLFRLLEEPALWNDEGFRDYWGLVWGF